MKCNGIPEAKQQFVQCLLTAGAGIWHEVQISESFSNIVENYIQRDACNTSLPSSILKLSFDLLTNLATAAAVTCGECRRSSLPS